MKDMAFDPTADLQLARAERRMEELLGWAKLRKRLAASVKRQVRLAKTATLPLKNGEQMN